MAQRDKGVVSRAVTMWHALTEDAADFLLSISSEQQAAAGG